MNTLYYGNNLKILREHVADSSVDLIYLDPPFQSGRNYNMLFAEHNGQKSQAQIEAFEDTWHWDKGETQAIYEEITGSNKYSIKIVETIKSFHSMLGESDMMAYLVMMAIRLVELHKVLKDTGSIYLHCDPTASHYLKIVMDAVFGTKNFRNEIIWHYDYGARSKVSFGSKHDTILFYSKSENWIFNVKNILEPFKSKMTEWRYTKGGQKGKPMPEGKVPSDVWDIKFNAMAKERLGYPTQKPEALLERIIKASSNESDVILDPFCGCGTTISVAHRLKRKWIGIDITHLAIKVMEKRLESTFGENIKQQYHTKGTPKDITGAYALKEQNAYEFQKWAVGLIGGRSTKQGGDKGIDGKKYFQDPENRQIIISVKSGYINPGQIRDLKGVVSQEEAAIGVFITLKEPTRGMNKVAVSTGFYKSPLGSRHQKIQILTIKELLAGKKIDWPQGAKDVTYKKAERMKGKNIYIGNVVK